MEKRLGITETRQRLADVVDQVRLRGEPFIIMKHGKPAAAVVPIALYERWQKERQELFDTIREIRVNNPQADPDRLMKDVLEAQQAVRRFLPGEER